MNSRTRKIFFAAVALLGAMLLREAGYLRLQWYSLNTHGEHLTEISYSGTRFWGEPLKGSITQGTSTTNTKQDDEDSAWSYGFTTSTARAEAPHTVVLKRRGDESSLFRVVREHLAARVADVNSRQVLLNRVEMSGTYLTPLYKDGSCAYSVSLAEAGDGFKRTASVTGKIEFNVKGLCSVRELEVLMAQKIGTQIEKSLKELGKNPK